MSTVSSQMQEESRRPVTVAEDDGHGSSYRMRKSLMRRQFASSTLGNSSWSVDGQDRIANTISICVDNYSGMAVYTAKGREAGERGGTRDADAGGDSERSRSAEDDSIPSLEDSGEE
jgi:hypothetical protein